MAKARSALRPVGGESAAQASTDRKSTRLNSSHQIISYAVFCLKKKKNQHELHKRHQVTYLLLLEEINHNLRLDDQLQEQTHQPHSSGQVEPDINVERWYRSSAQ